MCYCFGGLDPDDWVGLVWLVAALPCAFVWCSGLHLGGWSWGVS